MTPLEKRSASTFLIAIILLWITCLIGCSSVVQTATNSSFDPKTGITTTITARSSIIGTGDSKTLVDKVRASAGKTASVGASGVAEETTTVGLQVLVKVLLDALMQYRTAAPASTYQVAPEAQRPPMPPVPFNDPLPQADPRGNLPSLPK